MKSKWIVVLAFITFILGLEFISSQQVGTPTAPAAITHPADHPEFVFLTTGYDARVAIIQQLPSEQYGDALLHELDPLREAAEEISRLADSPYATSDMDVAIQIEHDRMNLKTQIAAFDKQYGIK